MFLTECKKTLNDKNFLTMLKSLSIQNYALISKLDMDFTNGLSVITGETGAGKSIVIGALSLILGQRTDAKSIKQGADKCTIEAVFDIASYEGLQAFFAEQELSYDPHNCILRREIWTEGKSRAFINDTPVGLTDLKTLGTSLIDIHSQHENLLLTDNKFQVQVLDVLANNQPLRAQYTKEYKNFIAIRKHLQELQEKAKASTDEREYLRFQHQQLVEAQLKPNEQADLEREQKTLSHLEEIKAGLFSIENHLSDDTHGVVLALKEALNTSQALEKIYPSAQAATERLQTAYLDLKDLQTDLSCRQEKLELDPERLKLANDRLDVFYSLQQKHKVQSVEELIALRDQIAVQLAEIENYEEVLAKLQREQDAAHKKVRELAAELSATRLTAGAYLERQLVEKVSVLGMPYMQFACRIDKKDAPDATGGDAVCFLFSANKNVALKPVAQTASGGEISRLMLGIKALIAGATALPTIIFDEIDTGVSGEVADKMGQIMRLMGDVMQVVTITHLPQIAAQGNTHYFVYKNDEKETTETNIRRLPPDERIREIAQMLSGSELTEAAIENAKELLKYL
ncbi:DNA repair protein RecN [Bacteroidia bacterium]|nr:DNA repair protein RecN [Bacteroidia bacterium]